MQCLHRKCQVLHTEVNNLYHAKCLTFQHKYLFIYKLCVRDRKLQLQIQQHHKCTSYGGEKYKVQEGMFTVPFLTATVEGSLPMLGREQDVNQHLSGGCPYW